MSRDLPILFSGPMVRALLDGRKTQTRRVLKHGRAPESRIVSLSDGPNAGPRVVPYAVGDRLWVREAHYLTDDGDFEHAVYAADIEAARRHLAQVDRLRASHPDIDWSRHARLRPGIHMTRWASRLTLTVTDVRVQRLQDINDHDARAEGAAHNGPCDHHRRTCEEIGCFGPNSYRGGFAEIWWEINGQASWAANPWVAAYTFTVSRQNIDASSTPSVSAE